MSMSRQSYTTLMRTNLSKGQATSRMSRDNLISFKAAAGHEPGHFEKLTNLVKSQAHELWSWLTIKEPELNHSMCKYYGHVIRDSWYGAWKDHATCDDCGAKVNNPKQLRKAVAARQ